ncbi:M23 family metallopeptidase [Microbacteriaceae bacterium 4G12]
MEKVPAATVAPAPAAATEADGSGTATVETTATARTWGIYKNDYSPTIYELVNGTTPTPLSYKRWSTVYGSRTPSSTATDYVRYPWSPTIYAVTFWPGGESAWQWEALKFDQWRTAGSPTARAAGWIKGSYFYQWGTAKDVFVEGPDGINHALTNKEWADSGYRAFEQRKNEGFRKLSWAPEIVRYTDIAGGAGYAVSGAEWEAEAYPRPEVLSAAPGGHFHKTADDPTIWYTGLTLDRPISYSEWLGAGKPEPTVTQPIRAASLSGGSPVGAVEQFIGQIGTLSVRGWALDPNAASAILVDVYVDGKYAQTAKADRLRPDVAAVYPKYGAAHGFTIDVVTSPGEHDVCVYAINKGVGSNVKLSCSTVTVVAPVFPKANVSTYSRLANTFTNNPYAAVQWPFLKGVPLTDRFGPRPYVCSVCQPIHNGLDFTPGSGSDIAAIADGRVSKVVRSSATSGFGTYVVIDHAIDGRKVQSLYAHMLVNSPVFAVGDYVKQGDRVGRVGNTGSSTGAHLHFEVIVEGVKVDPYAWLTEHNR